tara:strand:- start:99 stop:287 length:189 start_codon:yes stop_codon:yes gene_type:complete
MAKNIKVVFKGNKAPSGKNNNIEYMISTSRLKQLEASKMFDIEMVEKPKAKPKKKTSKKEKK